MTNPNMHIHPDGCNTGSEIPLHLLSEDKVPKKSSSPITDLIKNHEDMWEKLGRLFEDMERIEKRYASLQEWESDPGWINLDKLAMAVGRAAHDIRMAFIHMPCRTFEECNLKSEYALKLDTEYGLDTISEHGAALIRSMASMGAAIQ